MSAQEDSSSSISSSDQKQNHDNTISSYHDFLNHVHPVHLIFFGSIPLCLGAYAGYKIEMNRVLSSSSSALTADHYTPGSIASGGSLLRKFILAEEQKQGSISSSTTTSSKISNLKNIAAHSSVEPINPTMRVDAARLAFKALGIGSMLSIGGVGLLTVGIFKLCGCNNLQDLIATWKEWTPRKRRELEERFGIQPKSLQHEDVKATKGMTEEEEWEYIKKKYIPELAMDENDKRE
jgi:hypothetical protein